MNVDDIVNVYGYSGRSIGDSHLLDGFVLISNGYDGLDIKNTKTLLFHGSFQLEKSLMKFNIVVDSSRMINTLRKSEEDEYKRWVEILVKNGVGCVFLTGKVHPMMETLLEEAGIIVILDVDYKVLLRLSKVVKAKISFDVDDICGEMTFVSTVSGTESFISVVSDMTQVMVKY